jgi:putative transposase
MPEYRRIYQNGGIYFFTLVTYRRQTIFSSWEARSLLVASIKKVQQYHPFENLAYCILPDHLHILWQMPEYDSSFSMRIGLVKRYFTKYYCKSFGALQPKTTSRLKRRESTIWQRRFWEHYIRDQEDFNRHVNYIHYNPVKHGLVNRPADWDGSTFMDYVREGVYDLGWGETYRLDENNHNFGE